MLKYEFRLFLSIHIRRSRCYRPPFFYSAIAKINRKHRSVTGHGYGYGMIKPPVGLPLYAKTAQKYPIWREFLNPMVADVGDVKYPLGTDYHIRGIVEFTCPDADLT